jgi:hypothetical protein
VAGRPTQHGGGIVGRITAPSDDLIGADQCQVGLIDVASLISSHGSHRQRKLQRFAAVSNGVASCFLPSCSRVNSKPNVS